MIFKVGKIAGISRYLQADRLILCTAGPLYQIAIVSYSEVLRSEDKIRNIPVKQDPDRNAELAK
jgi:hypothetical protein